MDLWDSVSFSDIDDDIAQIALSKGTFFSPC